MKRFWNNNNKYKDSAVPGSVVCKSAISESILLITDTTDMAILVPIPILINISVHLYYVLQTLANLNKTIIAIASYYHDHGTTTNIDNH